MGPWSPPAKKARSGLPLAVEWVGEVLFSSGGNLPVRRLISGRLTSLRGSKPSEVLALHRTRMELL